MLPGLVAKGMILSSTTKVTVSTEQWRHDTLYFEKQYEFHNRTFELIIFFILINELL